MLKATITFPPSKALTEALRVLKGSSRFTLSIGEGRLTVEARDATALRAALTSALRILQAVEAVEGNAETAGGKHD